MSSFSVLAAHSVPICSGIDIEKKIARDVILLLVRTRSSYNEACCLSSRANDSAI